MKTRRVDGQPYAFEFLEAAAEVLTRGANKYGPYNWKRGENDFFLDARNYTFVHLQKFKEGDWSEDHLGTLPATWRSWSGR
jgi:dATP/dGTP diphosphohydrolase